MSKDLCKISILLPVYNNSKDVLRSINSVKNQTNQNWELIIIDDHSTDGTTEIIKEYLKKNPELSKKIRIITNEVNQGTYVCLNKGLQHSVGKYICRIDSDDEWDQTFLEKQSGILDADKELVYVASQCQVRKTGRSGVFGEIGLMYRKKIINEIGYYDSVRYAADSEFRMRIQKKYGRKRIYHLPEPLYFYHSRENSLTTSSITGLNAPSSGRQQYVESAQKWHDNTQKLFMFYPLLERPFPIDPKMLP